MYKYVLFDLDGTLTDPKAGICGSVQYALKKSGIEPPGIDELTAFIGPPLKDSFMEFYNMDSEAADMAVKYYRERFSDAGWAENEVYDGIPRLLKQAAKTGIRLAVASSKSTVFVEKILEHFALRKYFAVVVGSELDGRRSKKEEVVAEALRQLYGEKEAADAREQTAMVGDRRFDIEGARAEGLDAIAVSYGYAPPGELKEAGADAIAGSVEELRELLLGGEDRRVYLRKMKREEADANIAVSEPPKGGLLRALYVLAPFVIYFIILQILYRLATAAVAYISGDGEVAFAQWASAHSRLISVFINSFVMILTALLLRLIYRRREPFHFMPLWNAKEAVRKSSCIILLAIVLSAVLNEGLTAIAQLIVPRIYDAQAALDFFDKATYDRSTPLLAGILLYVLVSPYLEELVFRWLLCQRLRRVFSENITVVVSALFFGFYHGNILQGVYAFLMGLVLAKLRMKEDSIFAPLLFHMAANAFIFLAAYFAG